MKTYKFKINGNGYEVAINSVEGQMHLVKKVPCHAALVVQW